MHYCYFYNFESEHLQSQSLKGGCRCDKDGEKGRSEKSLVQHHLGEGALGPRELDDPLQDEIPGPHTGADQAGSQDEEPPNPDRLKIGSFFLDNDLSKNILLLNGRTPLPPT